MAPDESVLQEVLQERWTQTVTYNQAWVQDPNNQEVLLQG
jgi:hypothetical protein